MSAKALARLESSISSGGSREPGPSDINPTARDCSKRFEYRRARIEIRGLTTNACEVRGQL